MFKTFVSLLSGHASYIRILCIYLDYIYTHLVMLQNYQLWVVSVKRPVYYYAVSGY
jgi:hypothetical protein